MGTSFGAFFEIVVALNHRFFPALGPVTSWAYKKDARNHNFKDRHMEKIGRKLALTDPIILFLICKTTPHLAIKRSISFLISFSIYLAVLSLNYCSRTSVIKAVA